LPCRSACNAWWRWAVTTSRPAPSHSHMLCMHIIQAWSIDDQQPKQIIHPHAPPILRFRPCICMHASRFHRSLLINCWTARRRSYLMLMPSTDRSRGQRTSTYVLRPATALICLQRARGPYVEYMHACCMPAPSDPTNAKL
jgi:hypothetical protein